MTDRTADTRRHLRALLRSPEPDADLLARFVADRDEESFGHLVRRHGPMVWGVCRRVLRHRQDAEDAFQATFLVLARRAGAVRPRSLLANWLYGVAYRTALEARRVSAVRREKERRAAAMRDPAVMPGGPEPDVREALDRELAALPEVYRAAVVVCDLEGLGRRKAAERLGWSEGTLSGRLARARALLARRLARYGPAVPAGALGLISPEGIAAGLAEATVRVGVLMAAGEAVVAAPVAALSQGVMKAMLLTKLKGMAVAAVAGCAVLVTAAAGWRAEAGARQDRPATGTAADAPKKAQKTDRDRIAELERERDQLLKVVADLKDQVTALRDERAKEKARADTAAKADYARRVAQAADEWARKAPADPARPAPAGAAPSRTPTSSAASPAPAGEWSAGPAATSPIPATGGVPAAGTLHLTPTRPAPGGAPAGGQGLVTRVYQADGLAADEKQAESLVRVIQRTVEPDSWDARGGPGVAEYFAAGKSLVVRQTADVHKQVDELLGLLREAGKKAAPPGRGVP